MTNLSRRLLKKFLTLAGKRLEGEWVLMGGTVLPLLGVTYRSTVDIDLVGVTQEQQSQNLRLMELAATLHLPVETINQAGAYFLQKIPNFAQELIVMHKGPSAIIYRPNLFLYFSLKLNRLTETDVLDCLEYLKWSKQKNENIHAKRILTEIDQHLRKRPNRNKLERLKDLRSNVERLLI